MPKLLHMALARNGSKAAVCATEQANSVFPSKQADRSLELKYHGTRKLCILKALTYLCCFLQFRLFG